MEKIIKQFIPVVVAVTIVYVLAYFMGQEPNNLAGWFALGLAAAGPKG